MMMKMKGNASRFLIELSSLTINEYIYLRNVFDLSSCIVNSKWSNQQNNENARNHHNFFNCFLKIKNSVRRRVGARDLCAAQFLCTSSNCTHVKARGSEIEAKTTKESSKMPSIALNFDLFSHNYFLFLRTQRQNRW